MVLMGPYWAGEKKIHSSHRTRDCRMTQRSTLVLIGWGRRRIDSSHRTIDCRVTQRSLLVLMGPYWVGEKKDRLKPQNPRL